MKMVSPLLKHVLYPGLSKFGYLRRASMGGPTVLTYHGVFPAGYKMLDRGLDGNLVSADSFRRQLRFLKRRYTVVSPEEFLRWLDAKDVFPPRSVLLTCDDGLRNSLFDMLPILQEFELRCLFFVTGASLSHTSTMLWYEKLYLMFLAVPDGFALELQETGRRIAVSRQEKRFLWWELVKRFSQYGFHHRKALLDRIRIQLELSEHWDAKYREDPELSRRFLLLNRPELHQLARAGMCIGAHTVSHPLLSQSKFDVAWSEIWESKQILEQVLGKEIWALAYPFGDSQSVTHREYQMAEEAGFAAAFLNVGGGGGKETPRFAFPRVHITADMSLAELEARISGLHQTLQGLLRPTTTSAAVGSNS